MRSRKGGMYPGLFGDMVNLISPPLEGTIVTMGVGTGDGRCFPAGAIMGCKSTP